jgi:hypothetical protein
MATITVKAPHDFPTGTAVDVFAEPGGDVSVKGKSKQASATVAADGTVTIAGLPPAHYQVGGIANGVFRSFLAIAR